MRKFLVLLGVVLLAILIAGQFLPSRVVVERSVNVNRPAATVFTLLNGFRTWAEWSPWAAMDPQAEFLRSGPEFGVGARLDWMGDPSLIGAGWQEITVSAPFERIELTTNIGAQGEALTRYEVRGDQLGSRVTWTFETDVTAGQGMLGSLLGRYFGLFLQRWVSADFEQGLANLKAYAEALPGRDFTGAEIALLDVSPMPVLAVAGASDSEPGAIAAGLAAAYAEITNWALANDIELGGQPLAITRDWDDDAYRFEAAIPLAGSPEAVPAPTGRVTVARSPAGPAVRIIHRGPYEDTLDSYERLFAWMAAHGYRETGVSWEHYVTDPGDTPPEALVTHIYFLVDDEPPSFIPAPAGDAAAPGDAPGR